MVARKTPSKRPNRPGKHGGALLTGNPGNKGGTGRPPDEFKAMCQDLASSAEVLKSARAILKNPKHPAFIGALKWATENGYGKPKETVEHTGEGGGPVQVWVVGGKEIKF